MALILVIGGGLIGCGWAAAFAGAGHEVVVLDPDPTTTERLDKIWKTAQPVLAKLRTLHSNASAPKHETLLPRFCDVDLVQEALPEKLALKHKVLAELEPHIASDTPIASSSSGIMPEMIAAGLKHPERVFVAHPCNPPYLMPTVEIVGHSSSKPSVLDLAEKLYIDMGKTVLRMAKPMPGHLVNRLQFALWREAVHLVETGSASMADVERAVMEGLAPRWCLIGPGGVFRLSGGDEGMAGYLSALGEATTEIWRNLGSPDLVASSALLTEGIQEADPRSMQALTAARDSALPTLMKALEPIKADYNQKGERA